MLKLPKGLKKKKKGKKSKKDQELFTEEELKQYKREHQHQQQGRQPEETEAASDTEAKTSTSSAHPGAGAVGQSEEKTDDDEWSKFKALTAGVDSILHKTQDDLDRIKSTSFFKRVPPPSEQKKVDEKKAAALEAQKLVQEKLKQEEAEANRDKLAEAVVELSESESESEEADDIFDTGYIDAITSGELQLEIVPDSPDFDIDDGPDPFDTSYADKLIKGPEVSKRGKKLVSIGSAVEVLTGRVDSSSTASGVRRRPRRGPQDLLLTDNFDEEGVIQDIETSVTPEPPKTLLDDFTDEISDVPIDLSCSLHLDVLKEQQKKQAEEEHKPVDIVSEFDVLKEDEDDEFAELAAESLTKKEDITVLTQQQPLEFSGEASTDWAEFEFQKEEEVIVQENKVKPPRPPPARPTSGPHIAAVPVKDDSDDEFTIPEDDPFDTTFVEKVLPDKVEDEDEDDFDFDPRAEESKPTALPIVQEQKPKLEVIERDLLGGSNPDLTVVDTTVNLLTTLVQKDLLGGSTTDLSTLGQTPIVPSLDTEEAEEDFDPFDTSAVTGLVQPKATELRFLEKELLTDNSKLKHSLSDPDFDPRAEEPELEPTPSPPAPVVVTFVQQTVEFDAARRKSSLSLNIHHKSVGFLVPDTDLLAANHDSGKIQKPLTPYYSKPESILENNSEDPFDTSFVPKSQPTTVELNLIEKDLLTSTNLKHSLSDQEFDPRAEDKSSPPAFQVEVIQSDLLSLENQINIKVLTPALERRGIVGEVEEEFPNLDPFDTSSVATNILPGKTELKLIESEFLPAVTPVITTGVIDTLTDAQELGLGDKVLTPQVPLTASDSIEDIDPFDTSFANNLGPGKTEIKILETELIEN